MTIRAAIFLIETPQQPHLDAVSLGRFIERRITKSLGHGYRVRLIQVGEEKPPAIAGYLAAQEADTDG